MYKTKFFLPMVVSIICAAAAQVYSQNIFWLESAFETPRLVKNAPDSSELFSIALPPGSLPQSLSPDISGEAFLWTGLTFNNAAINRIFPDPPAVVLTADTLSALRGIALNSLNGDIYWTSTNLVKGPKIWRSDRNGDARTVLIDFGPASDDTPRSIGLDPANGHMYWTNFGAGKIQRADMSAGALAEDIISGLNGPSGLAVDADSGRIYWTEMNGHQIKSADLDGSNINLLVENLSYPHSIAINNRLQRMAWTEMGSGRIKSAALDGSDILDYGISAIAPTGIAIETPDTAAISGILQISPADTSVQQGSVVQYAAHIIDSQNVAYPTEASWSGSGDLVGPITQDGRLFTFFPGQARVIAWVDSMMAKASVLVTDTTADSSGINEISLIRIFSNDKEKKAKIIKEGKTFKLSGIKHPYNFLNGTILYFPHGSLHEDISLKIHIPKMVKVKGDSIEFTNRILSGITFNVFVNDSLAEPYYFDKPVSLAIPFNRGLLKKYGITAENLGLFYAADSVTFDTLGIRHVIVDSSAKRIYAQVEHFSSLVVREKDKTVSINAPEGNLILPERFTLMQNYPNPFNPQTTIRYELAQSSRVELTIFNMLGQKVATLVSANQQAGKYNVQWQAAGFASGIYLYRMETDRGFSQTKKLILLK